MGKAKPMLGYATRGQAIDAIKEIVNKYGVEEEFFHPLVQRLFLEHPYYGPGETFTKFKWIRWTLPNGVTIDRWFTAWSPRLNEWCGVSYNKCGQTFSIKNELRDAARWRVMALVDDFKKANPDCWHEGCPNPGIDAHHIVEMKTILDDCLAAMSADDLEDATKLYSPLSLYHFQIPDDTPFMRRLLEWHTKDILVHVCKDHHFNLHGWVKGGKQK